MTRTVPHGAADGERSGVPPDHHRGRDVVVDGSPGALALGQIFAAALGLPDHAVTTEQSTSVERQASWAAEGRIEVHRLGPGGRFRYKLDIDLRHAAIDTACFPRLARQHGLTIA